MFADPSFHLGDLNKASGESWQALSQEEREPYIKRAAEEGSSCKAELKQLLIQLAKLVCQIHIYVCVHILIYLHMYIMFRNYFTKEGS